VRSGGMRLFDSIGTKGDSQTGVSETAALGPTPPQGPQMVICVASDKEIPDPPKCEAEPIGIERGIEAFAALSTGELIDPVNAGKSVRDKRAKMQRRPARKQKHPNNWSKPKGKIARPDHRTFAESSRTRFPPTWPRPTAVGCNIRSLCDSLVLVLERCTLTLGRSYLFRGRT
jgi:hypothetical protein